jgi:hypothetical protein
MLCDAASTDRERFADEAVGLLPPSSAIKLLRFHDGNHKGFKVIEIQRGSQL